MMGVPAPLAAAAGAPPLLVATGLVRAFGGVRAVDGVSLAVGRGELVGLIGPNGAGKTTCFNLLNGQLRPDAGSVRLDGRELAGLGPRWVARLGVGRTFQITAVFPTLSAGDNLRVALLARDGRSTSAGAMPAQADAVAALLDRVGLPGAAETTAGALAYGDRKRLELAMALAGGPRLLLMDEPTAGMAADARADLIRLIAGLARETGLGVLFTEHDMAVVFGHSDRVLVMDRGRLIAEGPPADVRADPAVRRVYLGEP